MKTSQKFLLLLGALILVSGIILGTNPISDADQNKAENKENNLAISSPTFISKELYAVGKYYTSERLVANLYSKSLDHKGNGHFAIGGPYAPPYDTATTRARLNFGFNNPYYKDSGKPVSYTVKCKVSYKNGYSMNFNGRVVLSVLQDDGEWFEIFGQYNLRTYDVEKTWNVDYTWTEISDEYFRDDGSTEFKIVGQSVARTELSPLQKAYCTVRITNLHVVLTYDSDNLFPIEEVYAIGQEYNDEVLVDTLSQDSDNMGNGGFAIQGIFIDFPPWPIPPLPDLHNKNPRASLTFGVNNPCYVDEGRPDPYTVKFSIRYFHLDNDGNVVLYVLRDDGAWVPIFEKYGIGLGFGRWIDQSWTNNSFEYLRADGYMQFKLVAQSNTDTDGVIAGCSVVIEDLRVELVQEDKFPIEEVYTVGQYYKSETGVQFIRSQSLDNMGNGHFQIEGYLVFPAGALSTSRARLNFGFSNPYYENSGASDSYTVKCTIKYDNGDDRDGYVKLYVQDDQANWNPIWQKTGLSSTDETWFDVTWTNNSDEYYRDDGSMNFKIVGQSQDSQNNIFVYRVPHVRVEVYNLRVQLNYASDDLFPKDGVNAVGQYYKSEKRIDYVHIDVENLISQSLDNMGNGHFDIEGQICYGGYYSGTRARLNFGFNNPYYGDYGAPDSYTISCNVTYDNGINQAGYVGLSVQKDDGGWVGLLEETYIYKINEPRTWEVIQPVTRKLDIFEFIRDDGSMNFRIAGESGTYSPGVTPSCTVIIEDLRVILNYKPIANAGGPYYGDEGSPIIFDASDSFDLGNPLQYRWDFNNDGIWDTPWSDSPTEEHTWFDDYSGTVVVEVSNSLHTATDTATASITVVNVDPILDGLSATSIIEGSNCILSAAIVDPSNLDTFTVTIDWGDGSPIETIDYPAGYPTINEKHKYPDDNPTDTPFDLYTIKITIEDDDSGIYATTIPMIVFNWAPIVNAGSNRVVNEGTTVQFIGWYWDPGLLDTHIIEWDFGEGAGFKVLNNLYPQNHYEEDGIYTVSLRVTDDDGGVGTDTLTVTVNNVAPSVDLGPDLTVYEYDPIVFSPTITDPGADTFTYAWDFDNDLIIDDITENPTHSYDTPGTYVVRLEVTDEDGGIGYDTFQVNVIEPPEWTLVPFVIDDSGSGAGTYTWAEAVLEGWCRGGGSMPYILQNIIIDGGSTSTCIEIRNSDVDFILIDCTLSNSGTSGAYYAGIYLDNVENGIITQNYISDNIASGVYLKNSDNNIISNNYFDETIFFVYTSNSHTNIISGNDVTGGELRMNGSNLNNVTSNILVNSMMSIEYCDFNLIADNEITHDWIAIILSMCESNILSGNLMIGTGMSISGSLQEKDSHTIDTSNLVNGKPLYYYVNEDALGPTDFTNAGQIIMVNCNDCVISGLSISQSSNAISIHFGDNNEISANEFSFNTQMGIYLWNTTSTTVTGNTLTNNLYGMALYGCTYTNLVNNIANDNGVSGYDGRGIYLWQSNYSTISLNEITNNLQIGIHLEGSQFNEISGNNIGISRYGISLSRYQPTDTYSNDNVFSGNQITDHAYYGFYISNGQQDNLITDNSFIGNAVNARDDGTQNSWDDGAIGNYWDDYPGVDYDDDWIGDTPYDISGSALSQDLYPIWDDGYTPVAVDDSATTNEDEFITINVLSNDNDLDGDPLSIVALTNPNDGTVTNNGDGTITFLPDINFNGVTSFTYKAFDEIAESNTATVIVTVNAVNDAPIADDDTIITDEDVLVNIALSASDVDGDSLSYLIVNDPEHGAVSIIGPSVVYTPELNYYGPDSFTFKVSDGSLESNIATITINVNAVNDVPVALDDSATTDEDIPVDIKLSASDIDKDFLSYLIVDDPEHGAVSIIGPSVVYTPELNYYGPDSFTFKVSDGSLESNIATMSININAVNDAPVALDDSATTDEDIPVDIALSASDIDEDFLSYLIVNGPEHGALSIIGPNVVYAPDLNYYGPDSFTFKVSDGSLESNIATISININAVNDAPVALDDSAITNEDISVIIDLLANDYDVDDISLTIISVSGISSGEVVLNGDGTVKYHPVIDFVGIAYFDYTVSDLQGATDTASCAITMLDRTPPTTSHHFDGIPGNDDWFISSVNITLTADDTYSDISLIEYRINDDIWNTYSLPFEISNEGYNNIKYRSMDSEGNLEPTKEAEFKIDTIDPLSTLFVQDPYHEENNIYYVTKTTQFILSAVDDEWPFGSGVFGVKYRKDGGSWNQHQGDELIFTVTEKGPHTIEFNSTDEAGNKEEVKSIQIVVNAYEFTYIGDIEGNYSDPVMLKAFLFDIALQKPIEGKTIDFQIGSQTNSTDTMSDGFANCTIILNQQGGTYSVLASFEGDDDYLASSASSEFTIKKEHVYLSYTGYTVVPTTVSTIELRATILEDQDGYWGDLNEIFVTFTIYSVPMGETPLQVFGSYMVEFTNVDGVGVAIFPINNLPESGYLVKVSLTPGENYYHQAGDSDLAILTVYEPTGDFVTGGGWIVDSNGNKGNFGFNVKYRKNGLPRGQAIYVYREGDWEYIVKSNAWIGMAIIGNHSFFEAKCVVQQYNSKTGELLWGEGNYRMRVDVWDGEEDGNTDVYQIRVYDKNGIVYHEAGFDPYGHLMGGNIVIHIDKKK